MPLRLNWQVLVQRKTKKFGYFEFLIFIIIPCIAFCACYHIKRSLILEIQSPTIWILWHFQWCDHFIDFKQNVFKHHSLNSDNSIISKTKSLEACERQHGEYLAIVTPRTDNWEKWRRFGKTIRITEDLTEICGISWSQSQGCQ